MEEGEEGQEEEEVKEHCWMEVRTEKRGRRSEAPWRKDRRHQLTTGFCPTQWLCKQPRGSALHC